MKRAGLFLHPSRAEAVSTARWLADTLAGLGVEVYALASDAERIGTDNVVAQPDAFRDDLDLVFVLGGDGTLLRAAATAELRSATLLAVNHGHLGFLSTVERLDLERNLADIVAGRYTVEERALLHWQDDHTGELGGWALNEVIVARNEVGRAIRFSVDIGGEPLVTLTADGVIVATATGSTAYAFSAGGPLISPQLECLLVMPVSPHGVFGRASVVPPNEEVVLRMHPNDDTASLSADGAPARPLSSGATITLRLGPERVRLAKVEPSRFWRLVREKFNLSIEDGS
jgi:NAD+ kinase